MSGRRPHFSYANVTATLALVLAIGTGGAYAASSLTKNEVKSRNIAPGAVKTADLGKNSVKRAKVAPGAITGDRIAAETVTGAKILESSLGTVPSAANSELLDGLDSSAFVQGSGRTRAVFGFDPEGGAPSGPIALDVGGALALECRNPASVSSDFKFTNTSGGPVDVWTDKVQEFATPTAENYELVANGDSASLALSGPAVLSGKALLRFTIASASRLSLVEARLVFRDGGCRFPLLITELRG